MLIDVSSKEFLTLLEALQVGLGNHNLDGISGLPVPRHAGQGRVPVRPLRSRPSANTSKGVESPPGLEVDLPAEWLKAMMQEAPHAPRRRPSWKASAGTS